MGYAAIVLLPVLLVGVLLGLGAIVAEGRTRMVLVILASLVSAFVFGHGLLALSRQPATPAHLLGWDLVIARAERTWELAGRARSYLVWGLWPWALAVLGALPGLGSSRLARASLATLLVTVAVAMPLLAMSLAPRLQGLWTMDDDRWLWGYVEECEAPRTCDQFQRAHACHLLRAIESDAARSARLHAHVGDAAVEAARNACR